MGSLLSEGNHLYVDKKGPWKAALQKLVDLGMALYEQSGAAGVVWRDLPGNDPEMDSFMLDQGMSRVALLDSHILDLSGKDEAAWVASLSRRSRKFVQQLQDRSSELTVTVHGCGQQPMSEADAAAVYQLYKNVAERKLRMNVFPFPTDVITQSLSCPAWELVVVRLDNKPIAFFAGHKSEGNYAPLYCGIDYTYNTTHLAYRQMLLQIVRRAFALGATTVHFGMDADTEKARYGCEPKAVCAYFQVGDHFSGALMREIVTEVALAEKK
jgi:hypothetical protein